MSQRFHITFARPVRVRLGQDQRTTSVLAVDGALDRTEDSPLNNSVTIVTEALYTAAPGPNASPPQTKMRTTLYVHEDSVSSCWPLPDKN